MSKEPKLGLFQGIPVITRGDYFEKYEIVPIDAPIDSTKAYVPLEVYVTSHWRNAFYPVNHEDINLLGERLSRFMQKDVKVHYGLNLIKVWNRGQVVVGHRPPSFFKGTFVPEEDEKLYTF